MEWLRRIATTFLTMKRRWVGLIVGCLFWLVWMLFGFWSTILLMFLGAIGFVIGRVMEENQSWKDVVEKLLADRFID